MVYLTLLSIYCELFVFLGSIVDIKCNGALFWTKLKSAQDYTFTLIITAIALERWNFYKNLASLCSFYFDNDLDKKWHLYGKRMEVMVDIIWFTVARWSILYTFSANLLLRIFSRQLHSIWHCFALAEDEAIFTRSVIWLKCGRLMAVRTTGTPHICHFLTKFFNKKVNKFATKSVIQQKSVALYLVHLVFEMLSLGWFIWDLGWRSKSILHSIWCNLHRLEKCSASSVWVVCNKYELWQLKFATCQTIQRCNCNCDYARLLSALNCNCAQTVGDYHQHWIVTLLILLCSNSCRGKTWSPLAPPHDIFTTSIQHQN